MNFKDKLTVPNLLSAYRILAFPFIFVIALLKFESLFAILLILNLITDILDGWIARRFNMQTEFGARLDSIADFGTYFLAFMGVFIFKISDFGPHIFIFITFISLFVFTQLISLMKFKRMSSLHLYSWKIGGYIQGAFFTFLFTLGFSVLFFYIAMIWGILSFLEHIAIQLISRNMESNQKGIYWILKNKR